MATVTENPEAKAPEKKRTRDLAVPESMALQSVMAEEAKFELIQRKAMVYATSGLVPKQYQGKLQAGSVMIAMNIAQRMDVDLLMVMQNLYIVHGNPGWSAQFLIACFNQGGDFTAIRYKFDGEGDSYGCTAYCTERATGDLIEGTKVDWKMVKGEGWSAKAGSKWKTMPEQMFRYRAATFLVRTTAPEIGMGFKTVEELEDITPDKRQVAVDDLDELSTVLDAEYVVDEDDQQAVSTLEADFDDILREADTESELKSLGVTINGEKSLGEDGRGVMLKRVHAKLKAIQEAKKADGGL